MKKTFMFLSIFILLMMPFVTMAATSSVKVIDANGTDITKDNFEPADDKYTDKTTDTTEDQSWLDEKKDSSIKAIQTAFEGALEGFAYTIIDYLFEGAAETFESDVDEGAFIVFDTNSTENEDGTTYNIYVRNINPFDHPLVVPILIISFCFMVLFTAITVLMSILLSAFETKNPETYGDWKRKLSGEYTPYNPRRVHNACVWAIVRPAKAFVLFLVVIYCRYFLISTLSQTTLGVPVVDTGNIILQALTGVAIFVGAFQTSAGEFGIYTFSALFFVLYMLTDIIIMCNKPEIAKKTEFLVWSAFLLFCFCDLINIFFTSFGVITAQWRGSSTYVTVGIIAGATINFVLLTVLTVYLVLASKKSMGV